MERKMFWRELYGQSSICTLICFRWWEQKYEDNMSGGTFWGMLIGTAACHFIRRTPAFCIERLNCGSISERIRRVYGFCVIDSNCWLFSYVRIATSIVFISSIFLPRCWTVCSRRTNVYFLTNNICSAAILPAVVYYVSKISILTLFSFFRLTNQSHCI